ncbi:MAG: excinuclease ABC subunit UvrC [Gemmatimonadota bacterium]|nr:excinuclease ABC subunit UvrC [Gemmatimonadota bacterium]
MLPEQVANATLTLPESPGVYLWKAADGSVLYVGKAKRLKARVRSYVTGDDAAVKTRALMEQAVGLETIVVPDEASALVLEANLIKEHRPRFNVLLRDDKSYPFVKVTLQEAYPRVFVTRRVLDDGARYFGPYTDVGAMRRALNVVKRIFTVRSCRYDMPREMPERACLDFYIKRCKGPCVGAQSQRDYREMIDEVVAFLAGRADDVVRHLRGRMAAASDAMDYERAAELRDAIRHLERIEEPSPLVDVGGGDRDVIGYARDGDDACVAILVIRGGKLLAREHRLLEHVESASDADVLGAFMASAYLPRDDRAADVFVPFEFADQSLVQAVAAGTTIRVPQRGPRRELLDVAEQNARHLLEEFRLEGLEADERAADPVYALGRELGLHKIPRAMVCFDNSTSQGRDNVGSVVWFENGRPRRSEYRTMRIKALEGEQAPDDFASMREVVTRYFRRRLDESKALPDLVVVDGGKGQLSAAVDALASVGLDQMPVAALAKREEEVFLKGRGEPIRLARRAPGLRLLQRLRDEAHRTAVGYNRTRRRLRTVTSELLKIPGIGPTRRRALLARFGSLQGVREASADEIAALPGFSRPAAERLLIALRSSDPAAPGSSAPDAPDATAPVPPSPAQPE